MQQLFRILKVYQILKNWKKNLKKAGNPSKIKPLKFNFLAGFLKYVEK